MNRQFDFKKEWEKTKKQLQKFSQEAVVLAKKGEEEVVKFSRKGKLHLDATAMSLKIERLYHDIGKEYVRSHKTKRPAAQLKKLVGDVEKLEKDQRAVRVLIKRTE
ncbi:MAG TPA: hypothetical protein VI749_00470 [Candidatus Omnitrophota bacterium]|nr:hypothetical protein [Candidatus Omnitrophota bacterium]